MNIAPGPTLNLDHFTSDPATSLSLPAQWYCDDSILRMEKENVFLKTWQYVCPASELSEKGSYVTAEILDQSVAVIRGTDGEIRAFHNVCQHRGHTLLEGRGRTRFITCPYHAWVYGIDGQLRNARGAEEMPTFDKSKFGLRPVKVAIFSNSVMVNFQADADVGLPELVPIASEIKEFIPNIDELFLAHRLHYRHKTNWKNVIDNVLECYHCPVTGEGHKAFVELFDMGTWKTINGYKCITTYAKTKDINNNTIRFGGNDDRDHVMWFIWPNLVFLRYPGNGHLVIFNQVPVSVGETAQTIDFMSPSKALTDEQREEIRYFDEILQPEDISIMEKVQRGQASMGFDRGPYIVNDRLDGDSEHCIHHFHKMLVEAVTGRSI